ncbi:MAG TPA: VWA domain-containing protein [Polyangiaceae bacterium]|nr:VWA domain-containing protein [Polyangiaceae bacterium]
MTFTNPVGLLVLALLGPLVALYVLRAKRQRRVVSSVWLWREAKRDQHAARRFRRLMPSVPLFIEGLAVLALGLAAAGPAGKGSLATADVVAVVVDTSASMGASDGARTRLDHAKETVGTMLRGLGGRSALIVEAGREPHAATGVERDPERLVRSVEALAPRAETGDVAAAILLAEERLAPLPGTHRVVVVTDPNGVVPKESRLPLEVVRVGELTDNAAVTRFEVRRTSSPGARDRVEALIVVESFGDAPVERFVSLSRRATPAAIASRRVALGPHARTTVTLSFDATDADTGTGVVAELTPGDALAVDDRAFALVPPGPRLTVVLAPENADPWLARALGADPDVDLRSAPLPLPAGAVPKGALLAVAGACADSPSGGDVLVVAPPPGDCLGVHVGDVSATEVVTSWSDRDARLRFVSLDDVHLLAPRRLDVPHAGRLVQAGDATVMADAALLGRTGTVVGFDWTKTEWPLRASFVLFVRNVTELARADRARALAGTGRTGEPLRMTAPLDGTRPVVRGPGGEIPARVVGGVVLAEAPSSPGFFDVLSQGKAVGTVAVNMNEAGESDLRKVPGVGEANTEAPAARAPSPALTTLSPWLTTLALLAVVAEAWWLSTRSRRTGAVPRRRPVALAVCLLLAFTAALFALAVAPRLASSALSFDRPAWLLAGVAALAVALYLLRDRHVERRLVDAALGVAGLLAGLAAAGPSVRWGADRLAVIVAVDRSRSIDLVPDASRRVDDALAAATRGMKRHDSIAVVGFASNAALEEPLHALSEPRSPQHVELLRDATDLAAAIRRALGETPPGSAARIVLVSDGVATRGDTLSAAAAAALGSVPVDVLPLTQAARPNVRVEAVRAPARATVGETMDLRVVVRSTADTAGELVVSADGKELSRGQVTVHAGEDALFVRVAANTPGLHRYEARLVPAEPSADSVVEDDSQAAFVRVAGRARALVIEANAERAAPLRAALESAAFDVEVATATVAPATASELLRTDLVVLGDVPARDLSPDQLEQMAAYVEHLGGGLLLLGGKSAMGPGGYAGTPLERVSPVSFELRNERRRARLAEVIAIDYSGSMAASAGSHTKLELANEAAVRSAELLGPLDRLGVLHVDTAATFTIPLGPLGDKAELGRRVRAVGPGGGGIYVDRALEEAYAALDREQVEQKHVLLFADGDDAEQRERAPSLARAARRKNITTSVVALGRGQDIGGLEQLSRDGEGRFYLIEDANRLPAVFAEETTIAAGSAFHEEPFRARPGVGIAATRGIDFTRAPALGGYDVTTAKPRAEVALLGTDDDPVLAVWAAGTGNAGAFTSDYAEPWGTAWRAWPDAARLFAQLARGLARTGDDASVTLDASTTAGALRIVATVLDADGALDASRSFTTTVVGPDGFVRPARLEPTSPGTYEALVPLGHAGTYVADVRDAATNASAGTTGVELSTGDELEPTGTDRALLARIAALTGGKVRTTLDGVFDDRPRFRENFRPLATWLAAFAALAMLLGAAARRLPSLARPGIPTTVTTPSVEAAPVVRVPVKAADRETTEETIQATSVETSPVVEPEKEPEPATTAEILLSRRRRRR